MEYIENRLPENYKNKIVCGDSTEILKNLPDNCVDIVCTSPPYNFGMDYDLYKDSVSWEKYNKTLFDIFDECIRVLKFGGRIAVNIQPAFSENIPTHHIISNYFLNKGMIWKGEIMWDKNHYNCKSCAFGSWKSPSQPYLKYTWEFIEVFCKGSQKHTPNKFNEDALDKIDITAEEFKDWVNAKWSIVPERYMQEYGHPAMFPEELVERILKLFSFKGDVVLDPFNGAGTTCVVANKLKREYLGIDISENYCSIAHERVNESNVVKEELW